MCSVFYNPNAKPAENNLHKYGFDTLALGINNYLSNNKRGIANEPREGIFFVHINF